MPPIQLEAENAITPHSISNLFLNWALLRTLIPQCVLRYQHPEEFLCSHCLVPPSEGQQFRIDHIFVRGAHSMRSPRYHCQLGPWDQLRREQRRVGDGNDLIVIAMQNEGRHLDLLEIFREVSFGKGLDAIVSSLVSAEHPLQPKGITQTLRDLAAGTVGTIERSIEILEELRFDR